MSHGTTIRETVACPGCGLEYAPNTEKWFELSAPTNSVSDHHKKIHCFGCSTSFYSCLACHSLQVNKHYSKLNTRCKCSKNSSVNGISSGKGLEDAHSATLFEHDREFGGDNMDGGDGMDDNPTFSIDYNSDKT